MCIRDSVWEATGIAVDRAALDDEPTAGSADLEPARNAPSTTTDEETA